jgi:hypothetical protein
MSKIITYGPSGYCENCDETHDHPMNNIIEVIELPDSPQELIEQNRQQAREALLARLGITADEAQLIWASSDTLQFPDTP